ncbi:MAG: DUF4340 domain-containing protein [Thermoguttaceae bacterium]|nr:DUF4340 domain-containing protein [Thermoguttaceae bacterium]MDW8079463.1 DUF4340 domain-containing protein [Thermoguttaceae bacterium]
MNNGQMIRTATFAGAAVLAVAIALLTRPWIPRPASESLVGQELYPEFVDPLAAASLEIVKYDESTATLQPFKVALVNNRWSIPSHENYPADAKDQLAEAAASLVGLKILEVVTDRPGDHAIFGVVDPDPKNLEAGATGVGMRVVLRDKDGNELVNLIIGKQVPGQEDLRYVRRGKQDPVYVVRLKTDKLSTRFEDWIERDLLQLNTWDIRRVTIDDYAIDIVQGVQIPRTHMVLDYDDKEVKWTLKECRVFQEGQWVDKLLAEDEELDTTKLNDMKWALDDLKIVDVRRKPAGLSQNLRELGEIKLDQEALNSLAQRGFYVIRIGNRYELLSSEGEVTVLMKDGVQYVLRFGAIAAGTTGSEGSESASEKKDSASGGANRYLFVMAEFNPEGIPKPELTPLPELSGEAAGATSTGSGEKPAEQKPAEQGGQSAQPPQEAKTGNGSSQDEPASGVGSKPAEGSSAESSAQTSTPAKSEESKPAESAQASTTQAGETKPAGESQKTEAKSPEEIKKERERIEAENKRKLEEYEEKIKKGKERVQQLNERFAEWYYVISDEVYRKIRLGRPDVVRKKTQTTTGQSTSSPGGATQTQPESQPKPPSETQSASQPVQTGQVEQKAQTEPAQPSKDNTPQQGGETSQPNATESGAGTSAPESTP